MTISRRAALTFLGLGVATPVLAEAPGLYLGAVTFQHGVASGDPLADRVILWTRVTPAEATARDIAYRWRISPAGPHRRFRRIKILTGSGTTSAARDFTIKVDAAGLKPGQEYFFEFEANGVVSPSGRTRTLPVGKTAQSLPNRVRFGGGLHHTSQWRWH